MVRGCCVANRSIRRGYNIFCVVVVALFLNRFVSDEQVGPGLEICLRVGTEKAKALAAQHRK